MKAEETRAGGRWSAAERAAFVDEVPRDVAADTVVRDDQLEWPSGPLVDRLDLDSLKAVAAILDCPLSAVVERYGKG